MQLNDKAWVWPSRSKADRWACCRRTNGARPRSGTSGTSRQSLRMHKLLIMLPIVISNITVALKLPDGLRNPRDFRRIHLPARFCRVWSKDYWQTIDVVESITTKVLSPESAKALKAVREILDGMKDEHGVVDVFDRYRKQDIWQAMFALSRLQLAANMYERQQQKENGDAVYSIVDDADLIRDLQYYSIYANAAYGWKMYLAMHGRLHMGDKQAFLKRTSNRESDVLAQAPESRTHRPAYFLVRDRQQRKLVLCIRGTWSASDLLTALCCTARDFDVETIRRPGSIGQTVSDMSEAAEALLGMAPRVRKYRAHHGMLESAQGLKDDVEMVIRSELDRNPDYDLVIVGHSLGGGVGAVLGALWENVFANTKVFVFGAPCAATDDSQLLKMQNVYSVITEDDPFSCLSLGHVADVSVGLSALCEDKVLRDDILVRTQTRITDMSREELVWCHQTLQHLRSRMSGEKLYPPGRILYIPRKSSLDEQLCLREVPITYFQDLIVAPRMLNLTRHIPRLYENSLREIASSFPQCAAEDTKGDDRK